MRAFALATFALAAFALLSGAAGTAEARPPVFAEGTVGITFALGTKGYLEEREGSAALYTGVRAGAWVAKLSKGRRWGAELELARSRFTSVHSYVKRYEDPPGSGNLVSELVEPTYSRLRVLAGARLYMPIRGPVGWTLRGAAGIDHVSGTVQEIAPAVDVGAQLAIRLGPVILGLETTFATAFHDNEYPDGVMIHGYQPGFGRTVDLIICVTAGGVF